MIHLHIKESLHSIRYAEAIERAAKSTLEYQEIEPSSSLTIVLTDDAELHKLNLEFLDVDAPTDVLSFPSGDHKSQIEGQNYLGDVIISFPRALAQADEGGHPIEQELELLVVHGVLHLFGYNHEAADEKTRMWAAQFKILGTLGNPVNPDNSSS
jgi:probable rRNA maturation factor